MNFQTEIRNILGPEPKEDSLKSFLSVLLQNRDKIVAHRESNFGDPRYNALRNFANGNLPNNLEIKVSSLQKNIYIF